MRQVEPKIGRAIFLCALVAGLMVFSVEAAVKTIVIPSADEQLRMALNQRARLGNFAALDTDEKWVVVFVRLHPQVVQPIDDPNGDGDYPALKKAIEAIQGIEGIEKMVDGRAPSAAPAGDELKVVVTAQMRSYKIPEPPPEP